MSLSEVFIILGSINDKQLIKVATDWFVHEEMDIEREITNKGNGMETKSVEFQRYQLRRKRFKDVMD